MTFATETRMGDDSLKLAISAGIYTLMQRAEDFRLYRRTLAELRNLDAAQLADMGLHRGDITRAAREAVYGIGA